MFDEIMMTGFNVPNPFDLIIKSSYKTISIYLRYENYLLIQLNIRFSIRSLLTYMQYNRVRSINRPVHILTRNEYT